MPDSPTCKLYLGTVGWEHQEWIASFYPDALPAEWRLAYYANLFSCVYVPYSSWSAVDDAALREWRDETLDRFRFVLEAAPAGGSIHEARALAGLAPKCAVAAAGRVRDADREAGKLHWIEPDADLKTVARDLQRLAAEPGVGFAISRSLDLRRLEEIHTLFEILGT